ncbi:MAG: hypothetical protein GXY83_44365 [Rhodopirellula sp.]|nr:hypothetical protein [Rhodopirellula sp.]
MYLQSSPILALASSGELFRQILPFALAGAVALIALHLLLALIYRGNPAPRSKWNWWDVLIYLGTLGSVAVLGVTAFVAVMRTGELLGWMLFFHMFGAGALTAALPVLALSWAHANRLELRPAAGGGSRPPKFFLLSRLMFWVILASGFVVTMTMLVSMLPTFGTDGLLTLLNIHRYSGLVLVIAAVMHFYSVGVQRVGLQ